VKSQSAWKSIATPAPRSSSPLIRRSRRQAAAGDILVASLPTIPAACQ
jgi:hypothetical protein